ncbi:hypothetical protein BZG73_06845 [Salinivibrio siamensis]|uniref:Yip1 domain-containing protein n=1 Tax=Salinivibrio siamensis TaxID=414286 RepID=A0ABX3KAA5_9GAMM|nr:hypothetical protein [Salinivibrio siamensis]OOE85817.1 hypothetical protein BZG73_06845 [Salinivibrio siamensis]
MVIASLSIRKVKALSVILLVTQLVLIGFSYYYRGMASGELQNISTAAGNHLDEYLSRLQHYDRLEALLGYAAAGVWLLTVTILNVGKATKLVWAQVSIVVPMVISFLLSFF